MHIVSGSQSKQDNDADHPAGDGEYWQPNDEQQNNHEVIVYESARSTHHVPR